MTLPSPWRKTSQDLAPLTWQPPAPGVYDPYPGFPLGPGKIEVGYEALAVWLAQHERVVIDGYAGVLWEDLREQLDAALRRRGILASWHNVADALLPEDEVWRRVAPFLGGDDPIFGTRFTGGLRDFFDPARLAALAPDRAASLTILYGCGAALADPDATVVYVDVPKNEIQFRSRAGSVTNLGARRPADPKVMYKRFYFVDWPALNAHKADLLGRIALIVDGQRPDHPLFMAGNDLRAALTTMSHNYFRPRPWFEPGPWGGQWCKAHIPDLPKDVPNYAWSFELISPENGLMFESDGRLLEVSFDFLMYCDHRAVLGESADRFGYEFPIRFDFLDTFDGGNLSVQCHPRPAYIRRHFGETFTQDETYYILDCGEGANVYLGFKADVDAAEFRAALEESVHQARPVDMERFVQKLPAHKHDLFLIPNGTIHCSGVDNLVLEISATPYIFTFKMYDWMRLDLDGRPRPLNIARAFDNLYFERQGDAVARELVSHPYTLAEGDGWRVVHVPTHREHFYDVHRYEFDAAIEAATDGLCHVMSVVAGAGVVLETEGGLRQRFNYAETFVVPAAAGRYRLVNAGTTPVKVIKAFVKPGRGPAGE
ncbi:MAG: class I mannose-6-phosphate isomerase [Anaerolineae bacterium]